MRPNRSRGFTLIELMIAVVVLGILAAVAIPNYTQYVNRSNRAAAQQVLLEVAGTLERNFTTNGCYAFSSVAECRAGAGTAPALGRTQAPIEGAARYTIGVRYPTATTFVLTATRTGSMSTDPCGDFVIDQTGQKTTANGSLPVGQCWSR
jgi:type IV pilus assembly protein PilE